MKNLNKLSKFIFILMFCLTLLSKIAFAESVIYAKDKVDSSKVWTVKFNKPLDEKYIYSNICVYDKMNKSLKPVELKLDKNNNTVKVIPIKPYMSGVTYEMIINNGIKSESGEFNSKATKYIFTIKGEKNSNHIDKYWRNTKLWEFERYYNNATDEQVKEKVDKLIKREDEIIAKIIKPHMTDYEKELAIHDYIVNNAQYDRRIFAESDEKMPYTSYTAYGIIMEGKAVCEGYAEAMKRLCNKAGIECSIIVGYGIYNGSKEGHAWNIVNIQGKYYHVDVTWDDPLYNDGKDKLYHTYFNITDGMIEKDHEWTKTDYTSCTSTEYSNLNINIPEYDSDGDLYKLVKDKDELSKTIKKAIDNNVKKLSLKVINIDLKDVELMLYKNSKVHSYSISYTQEDIQGVRYFDIYIKY
ncbi:transglutaminase-like superfamily protein [Clostridium tepidiprofundi DSM 19306]|uniref:Transglutaminase-like superfamily protein n=1 Tax=Clostridium tepidiprofundi DSM 19306 TaxID=1121338 RepID=A0A151B2Z7_9CLOT|nr:transglutaminase domain-containing protein [Clostridium tepidiprofundi]KYH34153.1 transglutaminase-like superfamily protein [Clostridium tepidiprofundi DSM 19306]